MATFAEQIKDFALAVLGVVRTSQVTLTDAATITWNVASGRNAQVTLAGNRTLSITSATAGDKGTLIVIQDATGSRKLTLSTAGYIPGQGLSTSLWLKPTANSQTAIQFYYNGTNFYWSILTY